MYSYFVVRLHIMPEQGRDHRLGIRYAAPPAIRKYGKAHIRRTYKDIHFYTYIFMYSYFIVRLNIMQEQHTLCLIWDLEMSYKEDCARDWDTAKADPKRVLQKQERRSTVVRTAVKTGEGSVSQCSSARTWGEGWQQETHSPGQTCSRQAGTGIFTHCLQRGRAWP